MTTAVAPGHRTDSFVGTGALIRFLLHRDRVRLPVWIAGIVAIVTNAAHQYPASYPTPADLRKGFDMLRLPAAVALTGPSRPDAPQTYGVLIAQVLLGLASILVALLALLTVVRHTRTEEEAGRTELLRAGPVGRCAPLAAAITVAAGACLTIGILTAGSLTVSGVPSVDGSGAMLFGTAIASVGLVFTGVAAVTVQISEYGRAASGLAGAVLGAAYVLRAIGDVGPRALSRLSPIGWAQATEVFDTNRWWPLGIAVTIAAATITAALALERRRDLGAGLVRPRPGAAAAAPHLGRPSGLAFRLLRTSMTAWTAAMLLVGAAYGSIIGDAEDLLDSIDSLEEFVVPGADMADSIAAALLLMIGLAAAAQGVQAVQKLRTEETAGRAETILATAVGRVHWAGTHLLVTVAGMTVTLLGGGVGFGIGSALATGDHAMVGRMTAAVFAHLPSALVVVAVSFLAFGVLPRATGVGWAVIGWAFAVFYLGAYLSLPGWVEALSPFAHAARAPAEPVDAIPILTLTAIAVLTASAGALALRRRDIGT